MLRQDNHRRSKLQERRAARDFSGSVVPGSGNQWHSKGDVRAPGLMIECKTTTRQSYSVTKTVWEKLYREALLGNVMPVLLLDIDGLELVVLDKNDFLEMGVACGTSEEKAG